MQARKNSNAQHTPIPLYAYQARSQCIELMLKLKLKCAGRLQSRSSI